MKKIVLFFLFFSLSCFAWNDLTVDYMIVNAYKTFPSGLKLYLNNNRKDILKGAESVRERNFSSKKEVLDFICKEKEKIEKMIKTREKIKKIAFEFGRMFKGVAILSFPFAFENSFYSRDYRNYTSFKLEKFVFAFKRIDKKNLKAKSCKILVKSLYKESDTLKESIMNDYKIYGNSSQFDDLSAAFGSGSLLFSDSCFTMSALASSIWINVNGKLDGCLIVKREKK